MYFHSASCICLHQLFDVSKATTVHITRARLDDKTIALVNHNCKITPFMVLILLNVFQAEIKQMSVTGCLVLTEWGTSSSTTVRTIDNGFYISHNTHKHMLIKDHFLKYKNSLW